LGDLYVGLHFSDFIIFQVKFPPVYSEISIDMALYIPKMKAELLGLRKPYLGTWNRLKPGELTTTLLVRYVGVNMVTITAAIRDGRLKPFIRRTIIFRDEPTHIFHKDDLPKIREQFSSRFTHLEPHELSTGQLAQRLGTAASVINTAARQGSLAGFIKGTFRSGEREAHIFDDRRLDEIDDRLFVNPEDITRRAESQPLDGMDFGGVPTPEDICLGREAKKMAWLLSADCDPRHRRIFKMYFDLDDRGVDFTMEEIGKKQKLTRSAVQQIIHQILKKMIKRLRLPGPRLKALMQELDKIGRPRVSPEERNRIAVENIRLVYSTLRRWRTGSGSNFNDLAQEATIGFLHGIEKYDPALGTLSTYTTWWIRQAAGRYRDEDQTIRIPIHMVEKAKRLNKAAKILTAELGREPTLQELAKKTGIDIDKVREALFLPYAEPTIDETSEDNEGYARKKDIEDTCSPDPEQETLVRMDMDILTATIDDLLAEHRIKARDLQMFLTFFAEEETLKEVGDRHNLSRERARQIKKDILEKIRQRLISLNIL
jgi:RNA polymerase sigma factor (sigma-70 family)